MPNDAIKDKIRWDDEVALISKSHSITYLCGPKSFMQTARDRIRSANVLDQDIHEEVFVSPITSPGLRRTMPRPGPFSITFSKSKTTADWTTAKGSLLDLAEQVGVTLPANCRGGACGACAQTIKSGEVAYLLDPALVLEGQRHLLCCTVPLSDVVIDA
jgi:ferredoxin